MLTAMTDQFAGAGEILLVSSISAARLAAVEAVCQLNRDVGIPGHLREVDVRKEDIPALAQRR